MASGADRPTVFISHVHEDRNVAAWLQQELEESFLGRALTDRQKWRTIGALATEAGIDEDTVMDVLRPWDDVRFGTGKSGKRIAGLVERVGR
jgi:hypothetical protein